MASDRELTDDDGRALVYAMLDAGIRPPPSLERPGGVESAGRVLALTCRAAGLTHATAWSGLLAYIGEPDPGQYPKAWPTAGHILARTRRGQAALGMGAASDGERAFADFCRRMSALAFRPDRHQPARHLDADPYRNDAMFGALEAIGGPQAWRMSPTAAQNPIGADMVRKRWIAAYTEARKGQADNPAAVTLMANARPTLTVVR